MLYLNTLQAVLLSLFLIHEKLEQGVHPMQFPPLSSCESASECEVCKDHTPAFPSY